MRLFKSLAAMIHQGVERGFQEFVETYVEHSYRPTFLAEVRRAKECVLQLEGLTARPDSNELVAEHAFAWLKHPTKTTVLADTCVRIALPQREGLTPYSANLAIQSGQVVDLHVSCRNANGAPEVLHAALDGNRHV